MIFPVEGNPTTLYSDESWGGETSVTWINEQSNHWQCNLAQSEFPPVCGLASELSRARGAIDFSKFDALSVQLNYTGEASKLRIYLRNYNSAYSSLEDSDSLKFNSANILARDFTPAETIIQLSEFSVENWWLEERNIPRNLAHPELNNIHSIGIDYPYPQTLGEHSIEIKSIALLGPLIPKEQYYFYLLVFWASILVLETCFALLGLQRRQRETHQSIEEVTQDIIQKAGSTPAQESFSKSELTLKINSVFSTDKTRKNASLILFKVDHFQRIVEQRGQETANNILHTIHSLVADALHDNDTFARWGEEEFLILSTHTDKKSTLLLAERLRLSISNHTFELGETLKASLSIGGTSVMEVDDFGAAFMRAEQALYRANNDKLNNTHWQDGKI